MVIHLWVINIPLLFNFKYIILSCIQFFPFLFNYIHQIEHCLVFCHLFIDLTWSITLLSYSQFNSINSNLNYISLHLYVEGGEIILLNPKYTPFRLHVEGGENIVGLISDLAQNTQGKYTPISPIAGVV